MPDIIPLIRPPRTSELGPHRYTEYDIGLPSGHPFAAPEYESPEYQPVDLPAESRLFDPEIRPFMDPELIATIQKSRIQEEILKGLRAQTEERLEALPEEQKPAARKWLAESRARTAPITKPTTREEASQLAIRKIGFDPDLINANKVIQQQFQKTMPQVIQSVFNKRSGQLTPEENQYLQTQIIPAHQQQVTNSVVSKIRAGQGYYKRAMADYDKRMAEIEKVKTETEEVRRYRIEQERKDREEARKIAKEAKTDEKEIRTTLQKEYDRYKKTHPDYKGSIIDFKKALQKKEGKDELTKSQMLDDWRADYKTRLSQLEKRYGQFNVMTGMWMPNPDTIEEYKKEAAKLQDEYEKGMRSIFEGRIPKRMAGTLAGERRKGDYVSDLIKNLTKGY